MKLFVRYILLFLFLTGFTFTGKNKGPLQVSSQRAQIAMAHTMPDSVHSGKSCHQCGEITYINDSDSDEDSNLLSHHQPRTLLNNLIIYYDSLIDRADPVIVDYTRFVHAQVPDIIVPRFIRFHQLLIPFQA
ncbi:hypothetical protein [Chitinophaga sp. Cy-1792]|uniref:hypothetical protein n=1 Tax=Chitinophaga sp. Cy-1792 TaxID=2608339 RepID=UPI001422128E|nr:hypothetical protein [Chitinophaga sp. Cy-1792]NIG56608.1 hypothetical protein [Chitinophaga sp. Cy-1792]